MREFGLDSSRLWNRLKHLQLYRHPSDIRRVLLVIAIPANGSLRQPRESLPEA